MRIRVTFELSDEERAVIAAKWTGVASPKATRKQLTQWLLSLPDAAVVDYRGDPDVEAAMLRAASSKRKR